MNCSVSIQPAVGNQIIVFTMCSHISFTSDETNISSFRKFDINWVIIF